MELAWLGIVVHWIHVLAGVLWGGGQLFVGFVVMPMMLRRPAAEGRAIWEGILPFAGPLMGITGGLVFLLGLVRGTVYGPIRSFDYLLGSSYGHTFLTALVLTLAVTIYTAGVRKRLPEKVWSGQSVSPEGARWLRTTTIVTAAGLVLIVTSMVLMRFGL